MVGDRRFDVEGARTFHIESVGVTYGYGSMEELKEAKADYIVRSVAELKKFLMREAEEGRRQQEAEKSAQNPQPGRSQTRILWKMLIPFLMFILVKSLVLSVCQTILLVITDRNPDLKSLFFLQGGEEGAVIFNGNSSVALQAIAYAVAAWSIWKYAKPAISKTEDEMKLSHLKKEPVKNYVLMGVVTAGVALGLNIFLSLTGAVERSESYQAVAANQYSADFFPGLLCFGLVAPIAEELIFRGVVYCCLRRAMKPGLAIILSGCMFAAYHGNSVQGLYSFAMGYLLAYGFEYFGRFYVPAVMHIAANVLVYCLSYTALSETAFVSWPVCAVCLAAAGISAFWMNKERNIFK